MIIRKTTLYDIPELMAIYDRARQFMRETGNGNQWIGGYPSESVIRRDISDGNSYVCEDHEGEIVCTFCFFVGSEVNYANIYNGNWLNSMPYGVVHRLASSGKVRGVANFCFRWCFEMCGNIRVDTHKDNIVMQNILRQNEYVECGTIIIEDGSSRIAFQRSC